MNYRALTNNEIAALEQQGCFSEDWSGISVNDDFLVNTIFNTQFAGKTKLGSFREKIKLGKGISKPAGIRNSYIENCEIADNVYISDVKSLVNYKVEQNAAIENVGTIIVDGETTFGNGTAIEVLNEGGGRELPLYDKLSAQMAYLMVTYRHDKPLIEKLSAMINTYVESKKSTKGTIGKNARILNTGLLRNVFIGENAIISGASAIENGTIGSCKEAPVVIGENVVAKDFIILSGSKVDNGAIVTSSFVGQGVQLGKQFSAENSAFFANCEGFHGEACSVFAGPYTVSHHKSTLLIAGMFSFYNAGSGTNQSNHMYKLGPVHQGIVERGSKTGSFSYLLWPCRVGAFSVVMDKHAANFDTSELPFSYLNVLNGKTVVTPAMNLFTVGTARDSKKWPRRDRRNDPEKLDLINFDLLNPYTVQKMIEGSDLLVRLNESASKSQEYVSHKGAHIHRLMLRTSRRYYDLAINLYLSGSLVKKIKDAGFTSIHEVRKILTPANTQEPLEWIDVLGMITEKANIDELTESVVHEKINSVKELQQAFLKIKNRYEEATYSWCAAVLKQRKNIDVENISKQQLLDLLDEWKTSSVKFNNMILKDAEKEFDQNSMIGFGLGGNEQVKLEDFKAIRGDYESNAFVVEIKKESAEIISTHENLKNKLLGLQD